MAHWAEIDENNVVIRVLVGSNDDPDEGYQWLIENLGGRWLKTSYNTAKNKHILGGEAFRGNYAGPGMIYDEALDAFIDPKPFDSWVLDLETYSWIPPIPIPDSGYWVWNEETKSWSEQ